MRAHEIGLGDLARAFRALCPDDELTQRRIAVCLGLERREAVEDVASSPPIPPPGGPVPGGEIKPAPVPGDPTPTETETEIVEAEGRHTIRSIVETLDPVSSMDEPAWLTKVAALPPDPKTRTRAKMDRLFNPLWTRGILTSKLSVGAHDGPVDVEKLVAILANAQAIVDFPRLAIPTLRNGVQLLIDTGDGMAPFTRDQYLLKKDVADVVGQDHLRIGWFEKYPTQGVLYDGNDEQGPFQPPLAGATVLVLTDLGIGRPTLSSSPAGVAEWHEFIRLVREADCSLVTLLPYGRQRWPRALAREMTIVHWDRHTAAKGASHVSFSHRPRRATAYAQPLLRSLARRNPDAVELAKAISLAARIEPELLRAARLKLLPGADASAEVDLRFSSLVRAQSRSAMILRPNAVALLRRELENDGVGRLDECYEFLEESRAVTGASYAVRQEEKINYLALRHGENSRDEIERLLREALKTLVKEKGDQTDVARWALRAVPALPAQVRDMPVARELYYAANTRLTARPIAENELPANAQEARWLLPSVPPTATIGVRLVRDGVEFNYTPRGDMHRLDVPRTTPRILELYWPERSAEIPLRISLSRGQTVAVKTESGPISIQTIYGQRYQIHPDPRAVQFVVPLDYSERIDPARLPEKVWGQEAALDAVDGWLTNPSLPRLLFFSGGPGTGKTNLTLRLVQNSEETGPPLPLEIGPQRGPQFLSAIHFCAFSDPVVFVESIAAQLANRYLDFALALEDKAREDERLIVVPKTPQPVGSVGDRGERGSNLDVAQSYVPQDESLDTIDLRLDLEGLTPDQAFSFYLQGILERLYAGGFEEQMIILLDALDEAAYVDQDECIRTLLERANELPPNVRFIVTSRPTKDVLETMDRLDPVFFSLDDVSADTRIPNRKGLMSEERRRIVDLLLPYVGSNDERQELIVPIFPREFYARIDFSGPALMFADRLVDLLDLYGELEPGKQALVVLLEGLRAQVGFDVQAQIDQLLEDLGQAEKQARADPFDALLLENGRPLVNRQFLRDALRELVSPSGGKVLVVNGPPGSGKSHSLQLIRHIASALGTFRVIVIDFDKFESLRVDPGTIAHRIAVQMNLDTDSMPKQESPSARWGRELNDWLVAGIRQSSQTWWIIFDGMDQALLATEIQDFIRALVDAVQVVSSLRVVLLGYQVDRLAKDVQSHILQEHIAPIDRSDLEDFFRQFEVSLGGDQEAFIEGNSAEEWADWVLGEMEQFPADDPNRLDYLAKFVQDAIDGYSRAA